MAKLTDEIVTEAHRRISAGEKYAALAAELGVSDVALCNAVNGKTWAHLNLPKLGIGHARGIHRPGAKLTDELVLQIRRDRRAGLTYDAIAKKFAISVGTAFGVANRKSWTHVPDEQ